MAYIKPKEIVGGKVNLLISSLKSEYEFQRKPNPFDEGSIIHLIHSNLLSQVRWSIQTLQTVIFSFDLNKKAFWGPYSINRHCAQPDSDVSDMIHCHGYCKTVLGLSGRNEDETENHVWLCNQNTTFIPGLPIEAWEIVWSMLQEIRWRRIKNRIQNPRAEINQKFDDDHLDIALTKIIKRVNAIINELLYTGKIKENIRFSPDTMPYV